jgi:hypothetical protein
MAVKWCGWTGLDLGRYPDDTPLASLPEQEMRSVSGFLGRAVPGGEPTIGDLREVVAVPQRPHPYARLTLFGTPQQVADRMEEWLERTGIDGFNLMPCPPTQGLADFCELLAPELRRRGLLSTGEDPLTLRERYFGAGETRYRRPSNEHTSPAVSPT